MDFEIYLLLLPDYGSEGDQAIAYAQEEYLKKTYPKNKITAINEQETIELLPQLKSLIKENDLVFLQGGGNMGELYPEREKARRQVIEALSDKRIIIFPQTIYFDRQKTKDIDRIISIYSRKNITIMARDSVSYSNAKELFPKAKVLLTPDIVYSLYGNYDEHTEINRKSVYLCLRKDKERKYEDLSEKLISFFNENNIGYTENSMFHNITVKPSERKSFAENAIESFYNAEIVITDRLHGCIFSVITRTPCIVLPNNNHKIESNYNWIKDLNYIVYCDSDDCKTINKAMNELLCLNKKTPFFYEKDWNYDI